LRVAGEDERRPGLVVLGVNMSRRILLALTGVMLLFAAPTSARADILWGLDTGPDTLIKVDTSTGAVTTVGALPAFSFGGLDFDSSGQLYALLLTFGANSAQLFKVDRNTGAATLVGGADKIFESFEILGNVGYSADVFEENLYSIDLSTGAATLIGSHDTTGGDDRVTGLASMTEADLFGTRFFHQDLVKLNPATGGVDAVIGVHGLSASTSLAFAAGVFWTIPASTGDLYSLNPGDGSATLVFSGLEVDHVTGLTSEVQAIPEPTTLALCGLIGAGLVGYRLRRRKAIVA
jgi:hypothetical protein